MTSARVRQLAGYLLNVADELDRNRSAPRPV